MRVEGKRAMALGLAVLVLAGIAVAWALEYTRYRTARELEHSPYPLRRIDIDPDPVVGGVEYVGRIRLDLYIGRDGRVHRVEVLESTLPPVLAQRAIDAFSAARWQPGRKDGRELPSVKRVEVEFEPPAGVRRAPMRPEP
jgi:hypothetical protein